MRDAELSQWRQGVTGGLLPGLPGEAGISEPGGEVDAPDRDSDARSGPAPDSPRLVDRPPQPAPESGIEGIATAYGPSYNGLPLGCGGGVYSSDDTSIVAVGPARYQKWPCGTSIRVCGAAGCIEGVRRDSCPGCGANHVDLSEAGLITVCGFYGTCSVEIEVLN